VDELALLAVAAVARVAERTADLLLGHLRRKYGRGLRNGFETAAKRLPSLVNRLLEVVAERR
jgi:hypothetical protein